MPPQILRFRGWLHWRIILVLCVTAIVLFLQSDHGVQGQEQDKPLPLVSLVSVTPSVNEGDRITIVVSIVTPLVAGDTEDDKITGGIIVFDPSDCSSGATLVAFVFRPGQETRTMSHGVDPFPNDTPRTIRIAVNSSWDHLSAREGGYRVGHPSEMTVRVLAKDASPPPTPTPAPSSAYSNARASSAAYSNARLRRLHQRPHLRPPHQGVDRRAGLVRGRRRPQDQHPGLPQLSGPDRAQHQAQLRRQYLRPRQPRPRPLFRHLRLLQRQPRHPHPPQHRCRPLHLPRCLLRLRCPLKRPRLPPHPPRYPRQPPRQRRLSRPRLHRRRSSSMLRQWNRSRWPPWSLCLDQRYATWRSLRSQ